MAAPGPASAPAGALPFCLQMLSLQISTFYILPASRWICGLTHSPSAAAAKGKPGKNTENGAKGGVKDMFKKAPAKKRKKAESSESQEDAAGATQKGSRQPSAKVNELFRMLSLR